MVTQEKVRLGAQVTTTVRDELARLAAENDRSLSAEIRRALTAYIQRDEEEEYR